jgi:predicted DNA-binding transcriptional regulator AlpA
MLVDLRGLTAMLARSRAALERDSAAGRLPPPVRLGRSRRWSVDVIRHWVDAGCPAAREWAAVPPATAPTAARHT